MRTALSWRRERFMMLVREAHSKPSEWLLVCVGEKHRPALVRLACLRVLVCRDYGIGRPSGLPYPQRKKAVRRALRV